MGRVSGWRETDFVSVLDEQTQSYSQILRGLEGMDQSVASMMLDDLSRRNGKGRDTLTHSSRTAHPWAS